MTHQLALASAFAFPHYVAGQEYFPFTSHSQFRNPQFRNPHVTEKQERSDITVSMGRCRLLVRAWRRVSQGPWERATIAPPFASALRIPWQVCTAVLYSSSFVCWLGLGGKYLLYNLDGSDEPFSCIIQACLYLDRSGPIVAKFNVQYSVLTT
ncbi:hypothetical protein BT69DRAFT_998223 [Atractiella rhizophila]|nr:hypothetical protein BT69DRAFT_998223 [Atractiella rhizophila]